MTLNFGIPPVMVFQLEVYFKVDTLLTGRTAQQKGSTARWYSNKTSLTKTITVYRILIKIRCFVNFLFDYCEGKNLSNKTFIIKYI